MQLAEQFSDKLAQPFSRKLILRFCEKYVMNVLPQILRNHTLGLNTSICPISQLHVYYFVICSAICLHIHKKATISLYSVKISYLFTFVIKSAICLLWGQKSAVCSLEENVSCLFTFFLTIEWFISVCAKRIVRQ